MNTSRPCSGLPGMPVSETGQDCGRAGKLVRPGLVHLFKIKLILAFAFRAVGDGRGKWRGMREKQRRAKDYTNRRFCHGSISGQCAAAILAAASSPYFAHDNSGVRQAVNSLPLFLG